jgi:6-phosphogluconolactonase
MHEYVKFDSLSLLQKGVAEDLCRTISSVLGNQQYFTLVLSGGSTPVGIFDYILKNLVEKIEWSRVHVFWLDERAVPFESPDSNYGVAYRQLFSLVPDVHLFPIKGYLGAEQAALEYEKVLKENKLFEKGKIPQFDYILLGIGTDGHVASLFHDRYDFTGKLVIPTISPDNMARISMTPAVINAAKRRILLLSGKEKAKIVARHHNYRAKGLGINLIDEEMEIFVDKHAADLVYHL